MTSTPSPPDERPERQGRRARFEILAALLIPLLVVGIPLLTGRIQAGGDPGSASSTLAAGDAITDTTTSTAALPRTGDAPADPPSPTGDTSDFMALLNGVGALSPATMPTTTTSVVKSPTTTTTGTTPTSPPTTSAPAVTVAVPPAPIPQTPAKLFLDFRSPALVTGWDAVNTNTDGTPFQGSYEISFQAGTATKTYVTTAPRFTYSLDQNRLDFGTPQPGFTVTVRAVEVDGSRSGAVTSVAQNAVPATPTTPPALASGSSQITVTISGPLAEPDLAGFDIYESTSPSGPFQLIASTGGIAGVVNDVLSGTTHNYVYKTRDVFGQVSPGFSPTATATAS